MKILGYPCCKNTKEVITTDENGKWGFENNNWCGINSSEKVSIYKNYKNI